MQNLLGRRLKQARQERGLTLATLSENCGLSVGYLSKVEKGSSSIAVDKLTEIAKFFNINISYFFEETEFADQDAIVVRSHERRMQHYDLPLRYNFLLANDMKNKDFMPMYVELLPGHNEEMRPYIHEGQEFIFVLEGVMTLQVQKQKFELYPGDAAFFNGSLDHVWANNTAKTVKLLTVQTPNIYGSGE